MKFIFIFFYTLSLFPCNLVKKQSTFSIQNDKTNDTSYMYKIIKIDTIKNINVFFAKKNELTYKIVFFPDSLDCPTNIKVGQCYKLLLKSVFSENFGPRGRITAVRYGSERVYLERDNGIIWDLFYILNLKDLCQTSNFQKDLIPPIALSFQTE